MAFPARKANAPQEIPANAAHKRRAGTWTGTRRSALQERDFVSPEPSITTLCYRLPSRAVGLGRRRPALSLRKLSMARK